MKSSPKESQVGDLRQFKRRNHGNVHGDFGLHGIGCNRLRQGHLRLGGRDLTSRHSVQRMLSNGACPEKPGARSLRLERAQSS